MSRTKKSPFYSLVRTDSGFKYRKKVAAGGARGGFKSVDKIAQRLNYSIPIIKYSDAERVMNEWFEFHADEDINAPLDEKLPKQPAMSLYTYGLSILDVNSAFYAEKDARRRKSGMQPVSLSYKKQIYTTFKKFRKYTQEIMLKCCTKKSMSLLESKLVKDPDVSPATLNNFIAGLRMIFANAESEGLFDYNPVQHIKGVTIKTEEKGILSPVEISQLVSTLNDTAGICNYQEIIKLFILCAIYTGMREGEIRALKPKAIHPTLDDYGQPSTEVYTIEVNASWCTPEFKEKLPKSGKTREVYIHKNFAQILLDYIKRNKIKPNEYIFPAIKSRHIIKNAPISVGYIIRNFYKALAASGINEMERQKRRISFHSLRHYYDTQLNTLSGDMEIRREIMDAIGHATIKVDNIYLHSNYASKYRIAMLCNFLIPAPHVGCNKTEPSNTISIPHIPYEM